jgi:hypothetical protein
MRRFCSAPTPTAPSQHARGRLPCIRTRLWKRTESAVSPASHVEPASRCSCFDLCMGGGSLSCLATPWLLRARYAQPSPSFRSFSFRLATPHSHLRLREDRGLPVLGPCLPLLSPRRPPTSITRDSTAPWVGPPRIVALQHLPHCVRPSCTPIRLRPKRVQRRHRYALHAVVLHAVALHVVALHNPSYCWTRACLGLAASPPHTPEPRAFSARVTSCCGCPHQTITRYSTRGALLSLC